MLNGADHDYQDFFVTQQDCAMAIKADVIVIGGGSTGTGIARDLALRGLKPLLLE
ncbi:MAG: hypothetical protein GTO24_25600, partial [candidate division Zixibacteria bacterium]|nr:hypothetical protein [candidate division Zixibacteria bacterium]